MAQPPPVNDPDPNVRSTVTVPKARKAAAAALIGTSIEYYDYYAYATATTLVFGKLFFPENPNPFVGTMMAFGTFAAGFLSRPLGAIVFGHIGDRLGRKGALVTTLLLMGGATFLIGLLPTYAQVGAWAPLALLFLRLVQGFAVGGEWGGAALISVEHSPANRRTFYSSFAQLGSPGGTVLSSAAFSIAVLIGGGDLLEWAWRLPFLFSAVLIIVGLVIRLRLEESPVFQEAQRRNKLEPSPVKTTLVTAWKPILAGVLTAAVGVGAFYMKGTLFMSYAVDRVGVSESLILNAQTLAAASSVIAFPLWGLAADRWGHKPVIIIGLASNLFLAVPHYMSANTNNFLIITLMLTASQAIGGGTWVALPALFSRAFPVHLRYTGLSMALNVAAILYGGVVPFAAAGLIAATAGSPVPPISMLAGLVVLNLIGVFWMLRLIARRGDSEATPEATAVTEAATRTEDK